jgi:peptide/nickel transport system ATP-binding protein
VAPLLEVDHLSIYFRDQAVVRDLSFSVRQGEVLGLVGESGSGKSLTSLSILRLLDGAARVEGAIRFQGENLLELKPEQMRHYRGRKIAMIFQEPMTALNPVMPVGRQIAEAIETHQPELLIADEPTTALDVTVQAQILLLLKELQQRNGLGMLFISHDLAVVAQVADRVAVMRKGMLLETGTRDQVFLHPRHAYTRSLLGAVPTLTTDRDQPLATLEAADNAAGTLVEQAPGHWVRCIG